jgi:hypothetical protein
MDPQMIQSLKDKFKKGAKPTEQDFADLIDIPGSLPKADGIASPNGKNKVQAGDTYIQIQVGDTWTPFGVEADSNSAAHVALSSPTDKTKIYIADNYLEIKANEEYRLSCYDYTQLRYKGSSLYLGDHSLYMAVNGSTVFQSQDNFNNWNNPSSGINYSYCEFKSPYSYKARFYAEENFAYQNHHIYLGNLLYLSENLYGDYMNIRVKGDYVYNYNTQSDQSFGEAYHQLYGKPYLHASFSPAYDGNKIYLSMPNTYSKILEATVDANENRQFSLYRPASGTTDQYSKKILDYKLDPITYYSSMYIYDELNSVALLGSYNDAYNESVSLRGLGYSGLLEEYRSKSSNQTITTLTIGGSTMLRGIRKGTSSAPYDNVYLTGLNTNTANVTRIDLNETGLELTPPNGKPASLVHASRGTSSAAMIFKIDGMYYQVNLQNVSYP